MPLRSATDALAVIERELNAALHAARSVHRSRLVGFLVRVGLSALETAELEGRVAALEQRLAEASRPRVA